MLNLSKREICPAYKRHININEQEWLLALNFDDFSMKIPFIMTVF